MTNRQREILQAIQTYYAEHGIPPTVRELGVLTGITSTNGVLDHIRALLRDGLLFRARPRTSRGIVITPEGRTVLGVQP